MDEPATDRAATRLSTTPTGQTSGPPSDFASKRREDEKRQWIDSQWFRLTNDCPRRASCRLSTFQTSAEPKARAQQLDVLAKLATVTERIRIARTKGVRGVPSLLFVGPCGTGKDHLMFAMLREATESQIHAVWVRGTDVAMRVRDAMNGRSDLSEEAIIERYATPKLLAISDIAPPADGLTPFQMATLLAIVDRRYEAGLPTWASVNVASPEEAKARLGMQLRDRLLDGAVVLRCWWPSFRQPEAIA